MSVVIGLDIATHTGYAVMDLDGTLLEYGIIDLSKIEDIRKKLRTLGDYVEALINQYNPISIFIEKHNVFQKAKSKAVTSSNTSKLLGMLLGAVLVRIQDDIQVFIVPAVTARQGLLKAKLKVSRVSKEDVFKWAVGEFKLEGLKFSAHNDITDAILLAFWGIST